MLALGKRKRDDEEKHEKLCRLVLYLPSYSNISTPEKLLVKKTKTTAQSDQLLLVMCADQVRLIRSKAVRMIMNLGREKETEGSSV